MNTLACEKNPRIFSVVSFPLILCFLSVIIIQCTITVIRLRQISYETRLKIDTVLLHSTVHTYKTN